MNFGNGFFTSPERANCEGRHSDAQAECNRLIELQRVNGKPADMKMVTLLHNLAQALEGQKKYSEALDTRLRARDMLISLTPTS